MLWTIIASPCQPNTCAAPPVQRIGKQPLTHYAVAPTYSGHADYICQFLRFGKKQFATASDRLECGFDHFLPL